METTFCPQIKVVEVFRFDDGKTVFVGPLEGDVKYIPPCDAALVVNNRTVAVLHLEGEMMPDSRHPLGHRSVSTCDSLNMSKLSPESDEICLRIHLSPKVV